MLKIKPLEEIEDYYEQVQNYDNAFIDKQFVIVNEDEDDRILFLNSEEECHMVFDLFQRKMFAEIDEPFYVFSISDADRSLVPDVNSSNGRLDFVSPQKANTFVEQLIYSNRIDKEYYFTIYNPFNSLNMYERFICTTR